MCLLPLPLQVLLALGGREVLERKLRGRMRWSWQYVWRLQGVEATHAANPLMLPYENRDLPYAALPGGCGWVGGEPVAGSAGMGQIGGAVCVCVRVAGEWQHPMLAALLYRL